MIKIEDYYYLTVSTDINGNADYATIIRTTDLAFLEKYEYEDDGVKYDIEVNTDTLNDLDSKVKIELDESNEWITMEYDYIEE